MIMGFALRQGMLKPWLKVRPIVVETVHQFGVQEVLAWIKEEHPLSWWWCVLNNGFDLMEVSPFWQQIITGFDILAAVGPR